MRPHGEPTREAPDLEIRSACFGCGGDLAIRLRADGGRCVCRRCHLWSEAVVARERDGIQVAQLPVGYA